VLPVVLPSGHQAALAVTVLVRALGLVDVPRPPGLLAAARRPRVRRPPVRRVLGTPTGIRRLSARPRRITPRATEPSDGPVVSGQLALARPPVAGQPAVLVPLLAPAQREVARRDLTVPAMGFQAGARAPATVKAASARIVPRVQVVLAGRVVPGGLAVPGGPAVVVVPAGTVSRRTRIAVIARSVRHVRRGAQASSMARLGSVATMVAARPMGAGMRDRLPGPRRAVVRASVQATVRARNGRSGHAPTGLVLGGPGRVTMPVLRAALARGAQARATIVPVMASVAMTQAANGRVTAAKATAKAANARATATGATTRAANARATANVVMAPVPPVPRVRPDRVTPQPHVASRVRVALQRRADRTGAVVPKGSAVPIRGAARSQDPAGTHLGPAGTRGASPATAVPGSTGRPRPVRPFPRRSPLTSSTRSPVPS
jgi:hypothetical protein